MKGSEKMQNYVVAAEVAEKLGVSKGKAYGSSSSSMRNSVKRDILL